MENVINVSIDHVAGAILDLKHGEALNLAYDKDNYPLLTALAGALVKVPAQVLMPIFGSTLFPTPYKLDRAVIGVSYEDGLIPIPGVNFNNYVILAIDFHDNTFIPHFRRAVISDAEMQLLHVIPEETDKNILRALALGYADHVNCPISNNGYINILDYGCATTSVSSELLKGNYLGFSSKYKM